MSIIAKHIIVKGKVQGVFFRKYTQQKAVELSLKGWVKNRHDGNVEIFAQGDEEMIKQLLAWCWQGSPKSNVEAVESHDAGTNMQLNSFSVRY